MNNMSINPDNWSKSTLKVAAYILIVIIAIGAITGIVFTVVPMLGTVSGPGAEEGVENTTLVFDNYNYKDTEDLSFVNATIWTTTSSFDSSDDADMYPASFSSSDAWVKNASGPAEDISTDLSDYDGYVYIQVDAGGYSVFESDEKLFDFGLIDGNAEIRISLHQKPSNVAVTNIQDDTSKGLPTADGNYKFEIAAFEQHSALSDWSGIHVGEDWDTSESDFNDSSTSTQDFYLNEENFCDIPTLYNRSDDTANLKAETSAKELALSTEVPAYKFSFNDSIGSDGTVLDVNLTVDDTENWQVFDNTGNSYAFLVSENPLMVGDTVKYGISMGANITVSSVELGSLSLPSYTQPASPSFTVHGSV
jgi:hypothetical protein